MSRFIKSALVLALVAPAILAQTAVQCGNGKQCPSDLPCCSRKPFDINWHSENLLNIMQNTANVALEHTALVAVIP
jgi:hypothetical protein